MAYGTLKCDNITFTNGGIDQTVTVSGIVQSISGNITATGTIQGQTIIGTSIVSGATVTGDSGQYGNLNSISGVFTTQISGATVTGDAGSFTTVTGGVATITSGVFALGTNALPSISFSSDPNTGIYSPGADQVAVATNGTGRLFVASNGNVGIGAAVSSPGRILHVDSASTSNSYIRFTNSNSTGNGAEVGLFDSGAANPSLVLANTMSDGNVIINTNGDERLRITSAGLVGIGTSSPSGNLHVYNPATTSADIYLENTDGYYNFKLNNQNLDIFEGATSRLRIASGGNVGIGTTSPSSLLHLNSNSTSAGNGGLRIATADSNESYVTVGVSTSLDTAFISSLQNGSGSARPISFVVGTSSTQERMRIDTSGRLLVGTTTSASSWSATAVEIIGTTTNGGNLVIGRNDTTINVDNNIGTISFWGNDSSGTYEECARITADADLAHGDGDKPTRLVFSTTADGASSPTTRMTIDSAGTTICETISSSISTTTVFSCENTQNNVDTDPTVPLAVLRLKRAGKSGASFSSACNIGIARYEASATNARTEVNFRLGHGGSSNPDTDVFTLRSNGSARFPGLSTTASAANAFLDSTSSNNLLRSTSSLRYKKNIEDLEPTRSKAILGLRPVWYRSLADADRSDWSWYGLIAEEVAEVEPRLVHWAYADDAYDCVYETVENEDGTTAEILKEKTLKLDAEMVPDGVQYDRLTVLLLDVVKRQQQAIETLEAKVAALESA